MYQIVSNVLIVCILLFETNLFCSPSQNAKINLDCASKFRNPTYDSDEEHTKKKRARLGISRKDCSAAIDSFRQHVNEGFQASAEVPAFGEDTDMTDINNFVADV